MSGIPIDGQIRMTIRGHMQLDFAMLALEIEAVGDHEKAVIGIFRRFDGVRTRLSVLAVDDDEAPGLVVGRHVERVAVVREALHMPNVVMFPDSDDPPTRGPERRKPSRRRS